MDEVIHNAHTYLGYVPLEKDDESSQPGQWRHFHAQCIMLQAQRIRIKLWQERPRLVYSGKDPRSRAFRLDRAWSKSLYDMRDLVKRGTYDYQTWFDGSRSKD